MSETTEETMSDRLSEIEGRLAAATPGPWEAVADEGKHTKEHSVWADSKSDYVAEWVATQPDAVMLANAPADLAALVAFARTVEVANDRYLRGEVGGVQLSMDVHAAVQSLGGA